MTDPAQPTLAAPLSGEPMFTADEVSTLTEYLTQIALDAAAPLKGEPTPPAEVEKIAREWIIADKASRDPLAVGSTCRLIRAEAAVIDYLNMMPPSAEQGDAVALLRRLAVPWNAPYREYDDYLAALRDANAYLDALPTRKIDE